MHGVHWRRLPNYTLILGASSTYGVFELLGKVNSGRSTISHHQQSHILRLKVCLAYSSTRCIFKDEL